MSVPVPPEQKLFEIPVFLLHKSACEFGSLHLSNRALEFEPMFSRQKEVLISLHSVRQLAIIEDIENFDIVLQSLTIDSDIEDRDEGFLLESRGDHAARPRSISTELLDIFTENGDYADYFEQLLKNGETLTIWSVGGNEASFLSCDFYYHEFVRQMIKYCTKMFNYYNILNVEKDFNLQCDTVVFDDPTDTEELINEANADANNLFIREARVFRGAYRWCDFLETQKCQIDSLTQQCGALLKSEAAFEEDTRNFSDIYFKVQTPITRALCDFNDIRNMRLGCKFSEDKFNESVLNLLKHVQYNSNDLSESIQRIESVPMFDLNYSEILDISQLEILRKDLQTPGKLYVVYSSRMDGAFLPTLYNAFCNEQKESIIGLIDTQYKREREKLSEFINSNFIIIVKTEDGQICGFCGNEFELKQHSDYDGSILFVFRGDEFCYYQPNTRMEYYAYADKDFYAVGSEEYALWIDKELQEVHTNRCDVFLNELLFTGQTRGHSTWESIDVVEVFRFV